VGGNVGAMELNLKGIQEISVQEGKWGPRKALLKVGFILECPYANNPVKREE